MPLKIPFHCALLALLLNGIACACPAVLQVVEVPPHSVDTAHHHAVDDRQGCNAACDCDDAGANKPERSQAVRIDTRNAADDGDSSIGCLAPAASARRTLTVHPPPGLRAPPVLRNPTTPVSRFERMLD